MVGKKSVTILCLLLIVSLSFVSAGWFSNVFGKMTGSAITGNPVDGSSSDSSGTEGCVWPPAVGDIVSGSESGRANHDSYLVLDSGFVEQSILCYDGRLYAAERRGYPGESHWDGLIRYDSLRGEYVNVEEIYEEFGMDVVNPSFMTLTKKIEIDENDNRKFVPIGNENCVWTWSSDSTTEVGHNEVLSYSNSPTSTVSEESILCFDGRFYAAENRGYPNELHWEPYLYYDENTKTSYGGADRRVWGMIVVKEGRNIGGWRSNGQKWVRVSNIYSRYGFDGTLTDLAGGNGFSCSSANCPNYVVGRFGMALEFDENNLDKITSSYARVSDPEDKTFSYAMWIKTEDGNSQFFHKYDPSDPNGYYILALDEGKLVSKLKIGGNDYRITSADTYNDDSWHYVLVVLDREENKHKFYVDGELIGSKSITGSLSITGDLVIGGTGGINDLDNKYDGMIDELVIYKGGILPISPDALTDSCEDSDVSVNYPTGKDYWTKGTTSSLLITFGEFGSTASRIDSINDVCYNSDLGEYYCSYNPFTGVQEILSETVSCEAGCLEGACIRSTCQTDGDCQIGQTCENGLCIPQTGPPVERCSTDADCDEGEVCSNGVCVIEGEVPETPIGYCAPTDDSGVPIPSKTRLMDGTTLKYCDPFTLTYTEVKNTGTCLNDWECKSNSCLDGECLSVREELAKQAGLIRQIWCGLTNVGGLQDREKVSEHAGNNDYINCIGGRLGFSYNMTSGGVKRISFGDARYEFEIKKGYNPTSNYVNQSGYLEEGDLITLTRGGREYSIGVDTLDSSNGVVILRVNNVEINPLKNSEVYTFDNGDIIGVSMGSIGGSVNPDAVKVFMAPPSNYYYAIEVNDRFLGNFGIRDLINLPGGNRMRVVYKVEEVVVFSIGKTLCESNKCNPFNKNLIGNCDDLYCV